MRRIPDWLLTLIPRPHGCAAGKAYLLYDGFAHLAAGLACGLAGLAAGMAIGIVGDAGVRWV